ncbi:MAG TPA: ATP-binding protein [Planctomycetota bacterium]|nr:ATP-binding protein [Planctomycetota bacterium]
MSLRTKILASIFAFMTLVFGLLALHVWLHAAAHARQEARRHSLVVASLVHAWTADLRAATESDLAILARRLDAWNLVSDWVLVAPDGENGLRVLQSGRPETREVPAEEAPRFRDAFRELSADRGGARLWVPLSLGPGAPAALRLDLRDWAAPSEDWGEALRGILAAVALGTALLLLNTYVLLDRLVLRPLRRLAEASGRVAQGDFSRKIPEEGMYDEMGRVVRAFNLMIEKIDESHGQLRERAAATERRLFAAQRLSTAGTLAAGIAHEINNPLGGMVNAVRALQEGTLDAAKRNEYLDLVRDGLERIRAIVQKILQLRPRPFEPRPVALRDVVGQAIAFLDHRARAKGVDVRNDVAADLPLVKGDPLELQQAFLNILMNAVDACVLGEGRVEVSSAADGGAVRVVISDNGCGMTEEERARCMDPFFTTKDVGEGTGLGLAVARHIVDHHGGRIEIESAPGRGTAVTVVLPALRERRPAAETAGV